MKKEFLIANEVLAILACLFNLTTLQFVVKNFNLKTHVFTLLFLDSLNSTVCSIASVIFETILLTNILKPNFIICSWAFLVAYIPNCFGAILTLLIALTRYLLAIKAAKNIHPNNKRVTLTAIGVFAVAAGFFIAFFLVTFHLDISTVYFTDVCAYPEQDHRPIPAPIVLFNLHHNVYYILSLLTDIKMLRFLKTVILPSSNALNIEAGRNSQS